MCCSIQELSDLKAKLLEKVALSARRADIGALRRWSRVAEQCEKFVQEHADLNNRIRTFTDSLQENQSHHRVVEGRLTAAPKMKISPKLQGSRARLAWVRRVSSKGILLNGHNKRYYTKGGQSVGIAFANELGRTNLLGKWFLGLKDEPTHIAVLLCQDLDGKVYDFILPVGEVNSIWKALTRSGGQIKFHIRRTAGGYILSPPSGEPLNITKYIGKYQGLNDHASKAVKGDMAKTGRARRR